MPTIRYVTNDVPKWGTAAFSPVPIPTPLASTGGEQKRYLQQYDVAPDPGVEGYASTAPRDTELQGSYATKTQGLPGAFRPVVNQGHQMRYWTDAQNMGPNGKNTHIKIWSDNPLPVPARNPGRVAKAAMRTQPKGTIIATAWPRPFISWPTWGSSRQA